MPKVQKGPLIDPNVFHQNGWMNSACAAMFQPNSAEVPNHDACAKANTPSASRYEGRIFSTRRCANSASVGMGRPSHTCRAYG